MKYEKLTRHYYELNKQKEIMKEIKRSDWNYILFERDSRLIISVVFGSIVVGSINFYLNDEEITLYKEDDKYLDKLAEDVRDHPNSYSERNEPLPPKDK